MRCVLIDDHQPVRRLCDDIGLRHLPARHAKREVRHLRLRRFGRLGPRRWRCHNLGFEAAPNAASLAQAVGGRLEQRSGGRRGYHGLSLPQPHRRRGWRLRATLPRPFQRMPQTRHDKPAHKCWIAKADFSLGGVDVDVDLFRRKLQKQRQHGMAIARQHIRIGPTHRPDQQAVLHRATIDEQVLVIGQPAIEGRQPSNAGQPRRSARQIDHHAVIRQLARNDLRHPRRQIIGWPHRQRPAAIMFQRKPDLRPRHCQPPHHIEASRIFAPLRPQEFATHRDFAEQVFHPDTSAGRQRSGAFGDQKPVINHTVPAFASPMLPTFHRKPRNTGNRGQGLTTEAKRNNLLNRVAGQLRRRVALQRQRNIRRAHPAAIINYFQCLQAATTQLYGDLTRARIDRVLDQFLERRRRTLNHFARCNAVDQVFGKFANDRHAPSLAAKRREFETVRAFTPGYRHKFLAFIPRPC